MKINRLVPRASTSDSRIFISFSIPFTRSVEFEVLSPSCPSPRALSAVDASAWTETTVVTVVVWEVKEVLVTTVVERVVAVAVVVCVTVVRERVVSVQVMVVSVTVVIVVCVVVGIGVSVAVVMVVPVTVVTVVVGISVAVRVVTVDVGATELKDVVVQGFVAVAVVAVRVSASPNGSTGATAISECLTEVVTVPARVSLCVETVLVLSMPSVVELNGLSKFGLLDPGPSPGIWSARLL
mmetsp:Transcript_106763/g.189761  ORF Transcript_106763/g.189761 Transcript_106763/m.189761 type:complete len:239 (-) Transcript_106763:127-843(-)